MTNMISEIKHLLAHIETIDIIKKIENYRNLDFKKISDTELFYEILKVISVNVNGEKQAILFPKLATYPPKTRFYRARKIAPEDHYIPLKAMTHEQDAWNPPNDFITKRGRLNNVNESLLYTSPINQFITVEELKIKDNERFCLIVYESTKEINVSMIGLWEDIHELNSEENLKMRILSNFLNDEFTRDVGEGTEYLYRASERIAKDYFDSPFQDAWCYSSIAAKKSFNVCFRPENAKKSLNLVGVQICYVKRVDENHIFYCPVIASGLDKDKKFLYHLVNSPICKEKFPELHEK